MDKRSSFILHFDSLDILEELSKEQIADLFIAIRDYNLWNEVVLSWLMKAVFIPFKNQFDRDLEKYKDRCEINKNNGKKWWRPKIVEENPVGYLETQENQSKPKKPYNDNDSDSDSDSENKNNTDSKNYFDNEKLNKTYLDFLQMRTEIKKPLRKTSIEWNVKKVNWFIKEYWIDWTIKILEDSICNWWQWFFPEKLKLVKKYDFASMSKNELVDLRVETKWAIQPELRKFDYRLNAEIEHTAKSRQYFCWF